MSLMSANQPALRRRMFAALVGVAALGIASLTSFANAPATREQSQSQSAAPPKYEFDVVSIKIMDPDDRTAGTGFTADGMTANGVRLWWLFRTAYDMPMSQIVGMPAWVNDTRYLIEARLDPDTAAALAKLSPDQLRIARQQMLRAMMADRFALKFHTETRELPAYFMTIAKNGPKLQEAKPDYTGKITLIDVNGKRATDYVAVAGSALVGQAASMTSLAAYLSQWALGFAGENARPVIDRTGLTGRYDFEVPFSIQMTVLIAPPADAPAGTAGTPMDVSTGGLSLFKAMEESLGLKMESGKGPVPVFVIDHVEKPSAN
jgi:uncharacterized protein (TIGR03435 family)